MYDIVFEGDLGQTSMLSMLYLGLVSVITANSLLAPD